MIFAVSKLKCRANSVAKHRAERRIKNCWSSVSFWTFFRIKNFFFCSKWTIHLFWYHFQTNCLIFWEKTFLAFQKNIPEVKTYIIKPFTVVINFLP